jgi:hypothetical protein
LDRHAAKARLAMTAFAKARLAITAFAKARLGMMAFSEGASLFDGVPGGVSN